MEEQKFKAFLMYPKFKTDSFKYLTAEWIKLSFSV